MADNQSVGRLAQRLASLSPERREIVKRLMAEHTQRDEKSATALAFAQERLWFLDRMAPGRADYVISAAFRVDGGFDLDVFERSLAFLVARHEALRLRFTSHDGVPRQSLEPIGRFELRRVDLSALLGEQCDEEAQRLRWSFKEEPWNLAGGPLVKVLAVRRARTRHDLQIMVHHIAADGLSAEILLDELSTIYEALAARAEPSLPPAQSYLERIGKERAGLSAAQLANLDDLARTLYAGVSKGTTLPADHAQTDPPLRAAEHTFQLEPCDLVALERLCREECATLSHALLAVFSIALAQRIGQPDILLGMPVANRDDADDRVVGLLANVVAVRAVLDVNSTPRIALRTMRDEAIGALVFCAYPFERLVRVLHRPTKGGASALLSTAFSYQQFKPALQLAHLTVTPLDDPPAFATIELTCTVREKGYATTVALTFARDIYERQSIAGLARAMRDTLRRFAEEPDGALPAMRHSYTLTRGQLLTWLSQQMHPEVPIANEILSCDLTGRLDPQRFERAFRRLVDRVEILRARITASCGAPALTIEPIAQSPMHLALLDVSSAAEPLRAADKMLSHRAASPLPLQERLYDAALVRVGSERWRFWLNIHHVAVDATALALLYRELAAIYESDAACVSPIKNVGGLLAREALAPGRSDYVTAETYWHRRLASACTPLSFYGKRRNQDATAVHRATVSIGGDMIRQFYAVAQRPEFAALSADMSTFTIIATVTFAWLRAITGERQLSVGVPFHNRTSPAARATIGPMLAVCPVEIEIDDAETFASLGSKITRCIRDTARYAIYPVANPPDRRVYDVLLNVYSVDLPDFAELKTSVSMAGAGHALDAVAIHLQRNARDGTFALYLDLDTLVFDVTDRRRATAHFEAVLHALLRSPDLLLSDIEIRAPAERSSLLHSAAPTCRIVPITEQVAARAAVQPHAIALDDGTTRISYGDLMARISHIARFLGAAGVCEESRVGVLVDRTPDLAIAWLGILAAGGAFVALDPSQPLARLASIVNDARPLGILTTKRRARQAAQFEIPVWLVDECETSNERSDLQRPRLDQLAYVAYTSGSTGTPKGIMIEHGSLANYIADAVREFGLMPTDRVLQFGSPAVDSALEECLMTLAGGATLVAPPEDLVDARPHFARLCNEYGITVLDLPTAYFHMLAADESPSRDAEFSGVRLVIVGGERLSASAVRRWRERIGAKTRIVNTYGPAEATIVATRCDVDGSDEIPIGAPVAGVTVSVRDERGRAVPDGVAGELYIGGVGVGRGYLGRPGETSTAFLTNLVATEPGSRWYRTGDRVRIGRDGLLRFLGRFERQVKIRGFRVEPAELERALLADPFVAQAAVVPVGPEAALRLRAFVVAVDGLDTEALFAALRARLPSFLLPSSLEVISTLPMLPSGKIDYFALAERPDGRAIPVASDMIPGENERYVARIMADLLHLDAAFLTRDANFFDLGGHSLLGAQLIARVNEHFSVDLPLRDLFATPSVAGLAAAIASSSRTYAPIEAVERSSRELPLAPAQRGLWFLDMLAPGNPIWVVPAAVRICGALDAFALRAAFLRVITRHEILRTTFGAHDGEPYQSVGPPEFELTRVDLSAYGNVQRETEMQRRATEDARHSFDLERGPLVRATLLKMGDSEHVLLVAMHHIVADGWSAGILLRELHNAYDASLAGRDDTLPPLRLQYADVAAWQTERLARGELSAALERRSRQIAGAPATVLPPDRPRLPAPRFAGSTLRLDFDATLTAKLRSTARALRATPFEFLFAAFSVALIKSGAGNDLLIGMPVAGRSRVEQEPLIGFFVNTIPVRIYVAEDLRFDQLVARAREVIEDALIDQDVPFASVMAEATSTRGGFADPLRVMFTYLNEPTRSELATTFEGFDWEIVDIHRGLANRDLTIRLAESNDQIVGHIEYDTDLYDEATIGRFSDEFQSIVALAVQEPRQRLSALHADDDSGRKADAERAVARSDRHRALFTAAMLAPATPLPDTPDRQVRVYRTEALPIFIEPAVAELDLAAWTAAHRDFVARELSVTGALVFRGFAVDGADSFERCCRSFIPSLDEYEERSTPRTPVTSAISTSTEYPAEQEIRPHNEMSYAARWPTYLWFFCERPADEGGATPLVDASRVWNALDPEIRDRFNRLGVMYQRNYGSDLDLTWQTAFRTERPEEVEAYCRRAQIAYEWLNGRKLRTRAVRPASLLHRGTGAVVWFNAAHMFHPAGQVRAVRDSLRELFDPEDLPRNARYGDGSQIDDDVIERIVQTYRASTTRFEWQRGDVMIVDNIRVAHGREPFRGPRRILVAMAGMNEPLEP